jgi:hypothetical protein
VLFCFAGTLVPAAGFPAFFLKGCFAKIAAESHRLSREPAGRTKEKKRNAPHRDKWFQLHQDCIDGALKG